MTGASAQQSSVQTHALPAVAEVMRPVLSTAGPDDHLAATALGGHFRHLPVVGDADCIGIPGITDVCRAGRTYEMICAIHDRHVARRLERDPAG
jgi:hypothetical protein